MLIGIFVCKLVSYVNMHILANRFVTVKFDVQRNVANCLGYFCLKKKVSPHANDHSSLYGKMKTCTKIKSIRNSIST